ncbi:hypothetical protein ASD8599_00803 [Ascidiaceihabitans donghaensis]|uniref:YcxB-like protein domain-containing protein n=1 Tax=Ascidiaceihabitans donghaensis TaxID=1510460 RepID=A0A2R8BAM1_9RHOB|nr:hypothetical protein [Ascidiaceihabitans donghaensis]SPH20064.1 hypothetical protein ASD8599_00803 [Ascidiaceihabitans donghaensis]
MSKDEFFLEFSLTENDYKIGRRSIHASIYTGKWRWLAQLSSFINGVGIACFALVVGMIVWQRTGLPVAIYYGVALAIGFGSFALKKCLDNRTIEAANLYSYRLRGARVKLDAHGIEETQGGATVFAPWSHVSSIDRRNGLIVLRFGVTAALLPERAMAEQADDVWSFVQQQWQWADSK